MGRAVARYSLTKLSKQRPKQTFVARRRSIQNKLTEPVEALKFIEEFSQSFPSGADPRGEVGVAFEVVGMPTTYFVNLDGTIQAQKVGELQADELETYLKDLLSPKRP